MKAWSKGQGWGVEIPTETVPEKDLLADILKTKTNKSLKNA